MDQRFGISGIFMIIFLIVTGLLSATAVWRGRTEAPALQVSTIINGKWSPGYEHVFNKKLYSYEASKDGWGAINYVAFHEGNKGVLVGADEWLFTSEEFEQQPEQDEKIRKNLDYIHAVNDHFNSRGIILVVVPVPSKARLYREQLGRYEFPSYKENVYQTLLEDMNARGIPVVDTMRSMSIAKGGQDMFLKTDTHWTPEGARTTAHATAQYIAQSVPAEFEKAVYQCLPKNKTIEHSGDLLRYIPVGGLSAALNLPGDRLRSYEVIEMPEPAAGDEDISAALFSETAPAVTLVGTSYSANPLWNFEGFLKENLGTDVLNAADEGLGPFETMQKYLSNEAFRETPPKLVIWEIPERYLSFAYDLKTDFTVDGA